MRDQTLDLIQPIFLVGLTSAIEALLLWYIVGSGRIFLQIVAVTMAALLVGEASTNLETLGFRGKDPSLQRWSFYAFVATLLLFASIVAIGGRRGLSENAGPPWPEFALILIATIPSLGFRAYGRASQVND